MNGKLIDGATRAIGLSALAILALSHAAQAAPNLPLHNPGFEIVGLDGPLTVTSPATLGGGGHSAAAGWGFFHNTVPASGATTITQLMATTRLGSPGVRMIRVDADQPHNGIAGVTGPSTRACPTASVRPGCSWPVVSSGWAPATAVRPASMPCRQPPGPGNTSRRPMDRAPSTK